MSSIREHYPTILKRGFFFKLLIVMSAVFVVLTIHSPVAYGALGGSGNPGGSGSQGAYTRNGFGWYEYSLYDAPQPAGMKSGTWSYAQSQCASEGSDKIMAFVILNVRNGSPSNGVVYNYQTIFTRYYSSGSNADAYKGDNGHPWYTNEEALARFGNVTNTEGYTWGVDVAWFCYNSNPSNWSISATSTVNKSTAKPGDTVNWTHNLYNNGPTKTNGDVYSNIGVSGFNNGWSTGMNGGTVYSGAGASTSIPIRSITNNTVYTIMDSDLGNTLCQWLQYDPTGSAGGRDGRADPHACVSVPYNWSISTTSSADRTTAAPGDTIKWTHTVNNDGPTKTNKDVNYLYQNSSGLGTGTDGAGKINSGYVSGQTTTFNSYYIVQQSDVNKNLCRATSANPASVSNSGNTTSPAFCVFVPFKYGVTPVITLDHSGAVDAGSSMTATAKITNSGPTISKPSNWELTRIVVQPSKSVPNVAGGLSAADPCGTYFKSASASCQNVAKGTGLTTFNVGDNPLGDYPTEIEDLAIGTQICYALSVQPATNSDNSWNHSAPVCVTISKKPKIQILGGDLWVGVPFSGSASVAKVSTGTVTKKGFTFGSWIEYGIFSTDVIKGAGSGAVFAGQGQQNSTVCSSSVLSFVNASDSSGKCVDSKDIGKYATTKIMPDVEASFPSSAAIGNLKSGDLTTGTLKSGIYTTSGALTLSGGNISKGQWVVLSAPDADITIDGDIKYTNEVLNSATDIPQLIIIAKNIYITDKVKQIDAWLIAKGAASSPDGTINTCSSVDVKDKLTINLCNQQLVVNGPVMANKLYLRRTFGSDPCIGSDCSPSSIPAEIFNLRPDAFLWATGRSVVSGRLQTVYTTELPPRL